MFRGFQKFLWNGLKRICVRKRLTNVPGKKIFKRERSFIFLTSFPYFDKPNFPIIQEFKILCQNVDLRHFKTLFCSFEYQTKNSKLTS